MEVGVEVETLTPLESQSHALSSKKTTESDTDYFIQSFKDINKSKI